VRLPAEIVPQPPWIRRPDRTSPSAVGPHQRYGLLRGIGVDRLGVLWEAEDRVSGEPVIVRLLPPLSGDPDRAALVREDIRQMRADLSHRNAVRVIDERVTAKMPYVVSESAERLYQVAGIVERGGRFGVSASFSIAAQMSAAVAEAHEIGMVHGCLSTGSVCVTRAGHALVLDFGLRRLNWWTGRPVQPAEDVRETAFILLAMLLGHGGPAIARLNGPAGWLSDRLREAVPGLPPEALRLIERALHAEPDRGPFARDLAEAFGHRWGLTPDRPALPFAQWERARDAAEPPAGPSGAARYRSAGPLVRHEVGSSQDRVRGRWEGAERSVGSSPPRLKRSPTTLVLPAFPVRERGSSNLDRLRGVTVSMKRRRILLGVFGSLLLLTALVVTSSLVVGSASRRVTDAISQPQPTAGLPFGRSGGDAPGPTRPGSSVGSVSTPSPGSIIRVPDLRGLTVLAARSRLAASHLRLSSISPIVGPPGVVVRSVPRAGTALSAGATIRLIVGADRYRITPSPSATSS
jgi:hypothetical protein